MPRTKALKTGKQPKYRNKPVYVTPHGEIVMASHAGPKTKIFDSQREYRRWRELFAQQQAGRISGLRRQVPFKLHVNGIAICRYVADLVYVENGQRVVEDVKGRKTAMYLLKRKWMLAEYGIEIRET